MTGLPTTEEEFAEVAQDRAWGVYPSPSESYETGTPLVPTVRIGNHFFDRFAEVHLFSREEVETYIVHIRAAADQAWPLPYAGILVEDDR